MSKRVRAGDLDESLIIQSFKNSEIINTASDVIRKEEDLESQKEEINPEVEKSSETTSKSKNKRRRSSGTYNETFLKKKELKSRQPVYISQNIHQLITRLVHLLALADKDISVGGYIDNVLTEHLEQHKAEIAEMYRKQMNDFFE